MSTVVGSLQGIKSSEQLSKFTGAHRWQASTARRGSLRSARSADADIWAFIVLWAVVGTSGAYFLAGMYAARLSARKRTWLWLPLAASLLGGLIGFFSSSFTCASRTRPAPRRPGATDGL